MKGNATLGDLLGVKRWPEVLEVAHAWHDAGLRPGLPRVTQGVADALVALFADGFVKSDVLRVARYLPTTERFRDKVLPSCITAEVMAIALGELGKQSQSGWVSGIVAKVEAAGRGGAPEAIGQVTSRLAAAGEKP